MRKHITMLILPIKFSLTSVKKQHKPDIEVASKTLKLEVRQFALETESKLESHILIASYIDLTYIFRSFSVIKTVLLWFIVNEK